MSEVWKDIEGYEGRYQVSNQGRGKSLCRTIAFCRIGNYFDLHKKEKIFFSAPTTLYVGMSLCKNGVCIRTTLHRLIAIAFIPNPENKPHINHKDGNRKNNNVDNLEWCTRSENMQHAHKMGLSKSGSDHYKAVPVIIERDGIIKKFGCLKDGADYLGVGYTSVQRAKDRKRKCKGHKVY